MLPDEMYKKWCDWLHEIHKEVQLLVTDEYVFQHLEKIVFANPAVVKNGYLFNWIANHYHASQIVTIRRLIDKDSRSISFIRLFDSIIGNPTVLSRARFVSLYKDQVRSKEIANEHFDQFYGSGLDHTDVGKVTADRDELLRVSKPVAVHSTKNFAHLDEDRAQHLATYDDMDRTIKLMHDLVRRYHLMLESNHYPSLVPNWTHDWRNVLKIPWIMPADSHSPELH